MAIPTSDVRYFNLNPNREAISAIIHYLFLIFISDLAAVQLNQNLPPERSIFLPEKKISAAYLFLILFLSRLFVSFTYISTAREQINNGDVPVALLLCAVLTGISFLPSLYFLKTGSTGILTRAKAISPVFAAILAALYLVAYFFVTLASSMRFDLFASSVMFPDNNHSWFIAVLMLAAGYGAYKGYKTISRAALFITASGVVVLIFILATLTGKMRFDNLTPPFMDGISPVLKISLYSMSVTCEISTIPLLTEHFDGKIKRRFALWILCTFGLTILFSILYGAILGEYGNTEMFPIYAVALQAEINVVQRLDAFQAGIWILCVLVKLCFFLRLMSECLQEGFGIKNRIAATGVIGALITVLILLMSGRILTALSLFRTEIYLPLFLLTTVLLPLSVPVAEKLVNIKSKIRRAA